MPTALAGTAAVVVAAAVGGLTSASALTLADATWTAHLPPQVLAQDAQLRDRQLQQRKAAQDRELRASRGRARLAVLDQRRQEALGARQQAEAGKRAAAERARRVASSYVLPVERYRLTAGFAASGGLWARGHTGLDFSAPPGTPVRAVAAGVVVSAEWAGAYGQQVIVRHADGTQTWYCHLTSMTVRTGAVRPGQVIGRIGSTGNSTGPHLHLEVRVHDQPVDPARWLVAHGLKP